MIDETRDTTADDLPDIDVSEETAAEIEANARIAAKALGTDAGALGIATHTPAEIEVNAVAEANETDGPMPTREAVDAATSKLFADLERFSEGIDEFEIGAIDYTVATGRKDADGNAETETRVLPPGTYRLCTIKTLTGERRRRAHGILVDMGALTMRYGFGGSITDYIEGAAAVATSDRFCDLLGWLYKRTDDMKVPAEAVRAVGEAIDEHLNTENIVGIVNRFFSSNGSGPSAGTQGFLMRLLGIAKSWLFDQKPGAASA